MITIHMIAQELFIHTPQEAAVQHMLLLISLAFVAIGTITDLRTREVPDMLNYTLVASGLGIRLALAIHQKDAGILISGLLGFLAASALAITMFYAGQWGGGDAKMIMGLGGMLGMDLRWNDFFIAFLMNSLWIGAVYGIFWIIYLTARNWRSVRKALRKALHPTGMWITGAIIAAAIIAAVAIWNPRLALTISVFSVFALLAHPLVLYVKTIEKTCLIKEIPVEELTEGEWIMKDIVIEGKKICGPKDLGISMPQIRKLLHYKKRGLINKIQIKIGIPFVPSFLLALIATTLLGNMLLLLF